MPVQTRGPFGPLRKSIFAILATPVVWRASWRLLRRRHLRLDVLVEELRGVAPMAEGLRRPAYLAATVDRWLWALPPWGYGRCYKRSLLLLDLWRRCGLDPVLHLGARAAKSTESPPVSVDAPTRRDFHAWVSTGDGGPWTSDEGHVEIWRG
ncbi:MAG: hypothetical protein AAGM22_13940 [Acidobacteriota bacterium]